jgi:aldose 1-epimerase
MDFTAPAAIGSRIESVEDRNYDHCYVATKREPGQLSRIAKVVEPKSGRTMEVWTTEPGVQLYTARGLGRVGSKQFGPWHGFCLETQHFPDTPNRAHFPSTVLRPGETYRQVTVHRFSVSP